MKPSKYIKATTDKYDMAIERGPVFERRHLIHHSASITWESGYGNDGQVPGEIELCVGGKVFTYKVTGEE